nr:MAG TPA: hypothetical protein [Caudoviricetes sp.]
MVYLKYGGGTPFRTLFRVLSFPPRLFGLMVFAPFLFFIIAYCFELSSTFLVGLLGSLAVFFIKRVI